MSTSNVPAIAFTESGITIPTESDILDGVLADIDSAFGGGLNIDSLETPQGQLASSQTAIIADKNAEFAYFLNQIDPDYASGQFQDAIGKIYMMTRKPAVSTSVTVTLTGIAGTVIPALTLAQDTNGYTYVNSGDVTIGSTGTVTATFNNQETGPIACAAGTLTEIYQAINGWDAITNPDAGIIGRDVESRADFEYRRKNSVALNAIGTVNSVYSAVFAIDDVLDVYVIDNPSSDTVLTGSTDYPLLPHSIYVAAVGGANADIAKAIWTKKDTGCDYNGNTTVSVTDTSGYNYPYPTYAVKFNRPDPLPIKFEVQIVNSTSLPSNIVQLTKDAIIARFNGADGTVRERMGSIILASRYYGAVVGTASNIALISILIGTTTPTVSQVSVGIDQQPTLNASDISVILV